LEFEVVRVRLASNSLPINAHQVPARMIIDGRLPRSAVLGAAQKKPAVGPKSFFISNTTSKSPKLLIGNYDAAIAWNILRSDHDTVFDNPTPS